MSFTHTFTETWSGAGRTVQSEKSFTAALQTGLKETIADAATKEIFISIDFSALVSIYIKSDHDITLKTNSVGTPDDTLVLKADVPYIWNADKIDALKLTVDVVSIHAVNTAGAVATLEIEVLQDPTP